MSALLNDGYSQWLNTLPFAVVGASLLGSGHCIAMCGGLIVTVAHNANGLFRYHLGRLLGYCVLGSIAGLLGETIFGSQSYAFIPWISAFVLAFGFIFIGIRLWLGKSLHLFILPQKLWMKCISFGPGTTGLLSVFLPCGWLHTFVLGAVATRSASLGALYLFFFWLGTLPSLTLGPLGIQKIFLPIARRVPRLSAIILISIGIGSLGLKVLPLHVQGKKHCHAMSTNTPLEDSSHD